jgi:hypothetical protein
MTDTRFTPSFTRKFMNRPVLNRHDPAASHDARPSKRQR